MTEQFHPRYISKKNVYVQKACEIIFIAALFIITPNYVLQSQKKNKEPKTKGYYESSHI